MKRNKKIHRFTHTDPEEAVKKEENHPRDKKKDSGSKKQVKTTDPDVPKFIIKDLKQASITIVFFIFLLVIFYILNTQYSFLELIKDRFF